jgi:hypothetical protein
MKRLLIVLFVAGVSLGVVYARWLDPMHVTDVSPAQVTASFQETWISLAAEALAQDGDWERTRARLDALRAPNLPQTVNALFNRCDAQGDKAAARALAQLADRLGVRTANMSVYLITPVTPPTPRAPVTATPRPIAAGGPPSTVTSPPRTAMDGRLPGVAATPRPPTPVPTYSPTYQVLSQIAECARAATTPQIRVTLQDAAGRGVPGVTVWITWEGGADRFVTGLKPEIDAGYGDFDMLRDRYYNLSIDQPESVIVAGLRAEACAAGGLTAWRVVIRSQAR